MNERDKHVDGLNNIARSIVLIGIEDSAANDIAAKCKAAADYIDRDGWVKCSERLPEPGLKVCAYYKNTLGNGRKIMACHIPEKFRESDVDDDELESVYDEDSDTFYWPSGWYECVDNWDICYLHITENEVTHWREINAPGGE